MSSTAMDWLPASSSNTATICLTPSPLRRSTVVDALNAMSPVLNGSFATNTVILVAPVAESATGTARFCLVTNAPAATLTVGDAGGVVSRVMVDENTAELLPALSFKRANTVLVPSPGARVNATALLLAG